MVVADYEVVSFHGEETVEAYIQTLLKEVSERAL